MKTRIKQKVMVTAFTGVAFSQAVLIYFAHSVA